LIAVGPEAGLSLIRDFARRDQLTLSIEVAKLVRDASDFGLEIVVHYLFAQADSEGGWEFRAEMSALRMQSPARDAFAAGTGRDLAFELSSFALGVGYRF
jgi:hypothetical protein